MVQKRLVSRLATLQEVLSGIYHVQEGFNPNYVLGSGGMKISRIRVTGTIIDIYVSQDKNYGAVTIDDSTDTIRLKVFKELSILEDLNNGDIVEVIGKVREYNAERYIMPEIIVKRNIHFELLRKIEKEEFRKEWEELVSKVRELKDQGKEKEEILQEFSSRKEDVEGILSSLSEDSKSEEESTPAGKIIFDLLNKNDCGEGVEYQVLLEKSKLSEEVFEKVINDFLSDGTCYEPRPGVIKRL